MAKQLDEKDLQAEQDNLNGTCDALEKSLTYIKERVNQIDEQVKDQQKVGSKGLSQLIALKKALTLSENEAAKHEKMLQEAYFGRFDFRADGEEQEKAYYLGYFGFNEADEKGYRVLSWKAPLSEIFYRDRSRIEDLETTHEGDTVSGETLGKRRYLVDERTLLACEDIISGKAIIDSIAADDPEGEKPVDVEDAILMQILASDTEAKLKDIIRSIQGEQDKIIRLPLNRTLVVQGVAGSGKSTVGLHRIAFLLYNYRKALSEDAVLVLVPNPQFVDYIQDLLPMLETETVKQETFESLMKKILQHKQGVVHLNELPEYHNRPELLEAYGQKGSDNFISLVDAYIDSLYNLILKKIEPLKIEASGSVFRVRADEQRKLVNKEIPFNKVVKQVQDYVTSKLRVFLTEQMEGPLANLTLKEQARVQQELKEAVNEYNQKFMPLDLIKVYKHFWNTKAEVAEKFELTAFETLRDITLEILEQGKLERKDLAVLFHLKWGIEGREGIDRYRHIFVDEAQDYSPEEFWVIRKLSENHSMTLMGDIHQGIYRHRGLSSWEELMGGVISDLKPDIYYLNDSYRSTWEIVEFANHLIADDYLKARPVHRRGEPVLERDCSTVGDMEQGVIDFIYACSERKFRTVAIICQTGAEVQSLGKMLKKRNNPYAINAITKDADPFTDGVSLITVDRAKGLEFDAALVYDGSEKNYPTVDAIEKRRLYVALTRAKHYLWVLYHR